MRITILLPDSAYKEGLLIEDAQDRENRINARAKWKKSKSAAKEAKLKIEVRAKTVASEVKEAKALREKKRSNVEYWARIGGLVIAFLMVGVAIYSYLVMLSPWGAIIFSMFGVLFMSMAVGYSRIELLFHKIRLFLKL